MAVLFPSYVDALVEGFPMGFNTTSFPQTKYFQESQNVGRIIKQLLNRLSILLFHIDKKINEVLLRGGYLPKKLNQWEIEARALKYLENDQGQYRKVDSLNHEELVEMGIKIINHLKKCPFKDEMMYDKPVPLIIELGLDEQSTKMEHKHKIESGLDKQSTKMEHKYEIEQSPNPVQGQEVSKEPDVDKILSYAGTNVPSVELNTTNDVFITAVTEIESEPTSTTESMRVGEILNEASSNVQAMSNFMDITMETSKSSNAQKVQPHYSHSVPENKRYSFNLKDGHIELGLDHQSILLRDVQSIETFQSAPVNGVITLVETDIRELSEKPHNPNPLFLFLQRNNFLNHIDFLFFDTMSELRFLDLSDTKIRILPSSLFSLSKLEVLLLRNCICLDTLPSEIGKLNRLQVLDLLGSELYTLPNEIDKLTQLRYLQLSFYGPDDESEYAHLPSELISDNILSNLKDLEALSIIVHPEDHRWKKIASRIMENINSLEKLCFIQFYFQEVEMFQGFIQTRPSWKERRSWKFFKIETSWEEQRLKNFKFIVGNNVKRIVSRVPDEVESLFDEQGQSLRFVNVDEVPQVIKTVLTRVTSFYLDHHIKIKSLSEFGISNLKALKFCVVTECPKIQAILDENTNKVAFPSLEYLGVYYLWELKQICNKASLRPGNFKALKYLTVVTCPKLQFILWESMLSSLSNLEELHIEDCECMEKIVGDENQKGFRDTVLPALRKLVLHYLPKLVSSDVLDVVLLRLPKEGINIKCCPKLEQELLANE